MEEEEEVETGSRDLDDDERTALLMRKDTIATTNRSSFWNRRNVRILIVAFICSTTFASLQVVGGVLAHSLAIVADSVHMYVDSATYAINLYAEHLRDETRKSVPHPAGLYAATFSVFAMLAVSVILAVAAIDKLQETSEERAADADNEPDARIIVAVGIVGLITDGLTVVAFGWITEERNDQKHADRPPRIVCAHDPAQIQELIRLPNMCTALIHVIGDLLRSIVLIVCGAIAWAGVGDSVEIDAICTLIVFGFILIAVAIAVEKTYKGFRVYCQKE